MFSPSKMHRAAGRLHQPQDAPAESGLATTGLADQPVGLTAPDGQAHPVDRVDVADGLVDQHPALDREVHLEVVDLQQHVGVRGDRAELGGRRVRESAPTTSMVRTGDRVGLHRGPGDLGADRVRRLARSPRSRPTPARSSMAPWPNERPDAATGTTGLWQRSRCARCSASGTSTGVTSRQASISRLHRGAKAQPLVHGMLSDTEPMIGVSRSPGGASSRGIDSSRPCVYGCRGRGEQLVPIGPLHHPAAVQHVDLVAPDRRPRRGRG